MPISLKLGIMIQLSEKSGPTFIKKTLLTNWSFKCFRIHFANIQIQI